jgi:5-methylcytosine-specific restriction endonuclease McrA
MRCKKELSFWDKPVLSKITPLYCSKCEKEIKKGMEEFRNAFIRFCEDGVISDEEWKKLEVGTKKLKLNWSECLAYTRTDALRFLERSLAFASVDGIISTEEEKYFRWLSERLEIPRNLIKPLDDRFIYLKSISDIRQGKLNTIATSVHVESTEICYLEIEAAFIKVLKSSFQHIYGRMVATNQKLRFLSSSGGWKIEWKDIMRVEREKQTVYLELARKSGNGHYIVGDPLRVEAILNTLTKMAKRQLLVYFPDKQSRRIPQDVITSVYQRDQGKCVQCGASQYLEYDHIIPFSKGGGSTINNVQLLCHGCNLRKGGRI